MDEKDQIDHAALLAAQDRLKDLQQLLSVLNSDVDQFSNSTNFPDRRAFVRCVFAYVEGLCFSFQYFGLETARVRKVPLSEGEAQMAREVTYTLKENGEIHVRRPRHRLKANFRFALNLFAKAATAPYVFPASAVGFQQLLSASKIRDRLMHPRTPHDLEVSTSEIGLTTDALKWVQEQEGILIRAMCYRVLLSSRQLIDGIAAAERGEDGSMAVPVFSKIFVDAWTSQVAFTMADVERCFPK